MVFSTILPDGGRDFADDGVPMTSFIESMPFTPDIIHGQHHPDTMTAVMGLPGAPAIYHCHGALWRHPPPRHPRIYRYVAVSPTLAARLAIEANIEESDIEVVLNTVDPRRFNRVRPLPTGPARVLVYNRYLGPGSPTGRMIAEAVSTCGYSLDFIGAAAGKRIENPEEILPEYDIVFASGVSAIDALACGCAVIVVGRQSCGALVSRENFDCFRQANFSLPVNSPPTSTAAITGELRRYRSHECSAVAARLRQEADCEAAVERFESMYENCIAEHRSADGDPRAEQLAAARYLRILSPVILQFDERASRADGTALASASARRNVADSLMAVRAPARLGANIRSETRSGVGGINTGAAVRRQVRD
jgi:hypothetical protein